VSIKSDIAYFHTHLGNSLDELRHTRSVAYSAEQVLLNKHQISVGGAYLDCYPRLFDRYTGKRKGKIHLRSTKIAAHAVLAALSSQRDGEQPGRSLSPRSAIQRYVALVCRFNGLHRRVIALAQWFGWQSIAGRLSLPCARSTADRRRLCW